MRRACWAFTMSIVDLARLGHRLLHRLLGDLVEQHPVQRRLGVELVGHVPGDRLPLPVRVGGQIDGARRLGGLLQVVEGLGLSFNSDVLGLEPVVDVHPELSGGEVAEVADRRLHVVARGPDTSRCSWPWSGDSTTTKASPPALRRAAAGGALERLRGFLVGDGRCRFGVDRRGSPLHRRLLASRELHCGF